MSQTQWYIHEGEENNKKVLVSEKSYNSNNDSLISIKEQHNIDNLVEKVKRYKALGKQCLSQKNDNVNRYLRETEGMNDLNKSGRLKSRFEHTNWKLDLQLQSYSNKISKYKMLLRLKEIKIERKQSLSLSEDINNNNLIYTKNNNNNNDSNNNDKNLPYIKIKNANMCTNKRLILPRLFFSSYGSADDISKHIECDDQHHQPSHYHHLKEGPLRLFKNPRRLSLFQGKKCKSAFDLTPDDQKLSFNFDIKQQQAKKQKSHKKNKKLNNTSIFHITTDMYNNDDNNNDDSITLLEKERVAREELLSKMEEEGLWDEHLMLKFTDCEVQFDRMLKDRKLLTDQTANKCVLEERLVDVLTEQIQEINSLKNDMASLEDEIQCKENEKNETVLKALEQCHQTLLKIEQNNDQPIRSDFKLSHMFLHSTNQALEMLASIFVLLASSISSSCAFIYHHHQVSLLSLAVAIVASIAWWY